MKYHVSFMVSAPSKLEALALAVAPAYREQATVRAQMAHPAMAAEALASIAKKKMEHIVVLTLNVRLQILGKHVVARGGLDSCSVYARDVFAYALRDGAVAIVVGHNHPSGNTANPSDEDIALSRKLASVGKEMGICLTDFIIISPQGNFLSFAQEGLLIGALETKETVLHEKEA